MICVYVTENITNRGGKESFVKSVLSRHTAAPIEILREENGKPYLKDNPVYFNLTHSGGFCALAVSDSPVGVDMEAYGRGVRRAVLSSFGADEQAEITDEKDFLTHWTAREAFIKYLGGTLTDMLKDLEYYGNLLRYKGAAVTARPQFYYTDKYVIAVCGIQTDNDITYAVL